MKKNNWIYKVIIMTFIFSIIFNGISNSIIYNANIYIILITLIFIIGISILFDMIGTSVLTSNKQALHSMSSKKIKGAKEALIIKKYEVEISNLCLDVLGDICGVLSGSLGALLAVNLINKFNLPSTLTIVLVGAFISSVIVGGKAAFKNIGISKSDYIVMNLGKIYHFFKIKK